MFFKNSVVSFLFLFFFMGIADLAVAMDCDSVKAGSLKRGRAGGANGNYNPEIVKISYRPVWKLVPEDLNEKRVFDRHDVDEQPFPNSPIDKMCDSLLEIQGDQHLNVFHSLYNSLLNYLTDLGQVSTRQNHFLDYSSSELLDDVRGDLIVKDPSQVIPEYLLSYTQMRAARVLDDEYISDACESWCTHFQAEMLRNLQNPFPAIRTLKQAKSCVSFIHKCHTDALVKAQFVRIRLNCEFPLLSENQKKWIAVLNKTEDILSQSISWSKDCLLLLGGVNKITESILDLRPEEDLLKTFQDDDFDFSGIDWSGIGFK